MKRLAVLTTALLLTQFAASQSLQDYLKVRSKNRIVQPVSNGSLAKITSPKIVEIQGVIKGVFKSNDSQSIMFDRTDGQTQIIDAPKVPEWLSGNEVPVRLLVRVSRSSDTDPLKCEFVAAAPDADIRKIDDAYWRKEASKKEASKKALASRGTYLRGAIGRTPRTTEWILPASDVTPIYAAFIKNHNRKLSREKATEIAQAVVGFSLHYGVDARLIMAILIAESDFDPKTTSHSGAMGLGQLMPDLARDLGVTNAYDTNQNLYGTVRSVRSHLLTYQKKTGESFQSLVLALAAYNAGPGAVKKYGGVPPYRETQNYVRKVIRLYKQLKGDS